MDISFDLYDPKGDYVSVDLTKAAIEEARSGKLRDVPAVDTSSVEAMFKSMGLWKRHIQGDFLLIWIDQDANEIDLVRLGSHSELFGKGIKR